MTNYLYTTDRTDDKINSVDVSTKTEPSIADTLSDAAFGDTNKVDTLGDKLVATQRDGAVSVIDISDPTNLSLDGDTGSLTGFSDIYGVVADGDYAYAVDRGGLVGAVDISDASNPSLEGSVSDETILEGATGVDKSGDYVFVACGRETGGTGFNDRVAAVDVSDPTNPSIADDVSDSDDLDGADAIKIHGEYAYIGTWNSETLTVIDISNPSNLSIADVNQTDLMEQCFQIDTISVNNTDYAFCSAKGVADPLQDEGGIAVFDISTPTDVELLDTITLENGANMHGCQVDETHAYGLATNDGALTVIEWEDNR